MKKTTYQKVLLLFSIFALYISLLITQQSINIQGSTYQPMISAGIYTTLGLKPEGTVLGAGLNDRGQLDISSWGNIIQVATSGYNSFGLRANGTVVAVGDNSSGQCNVEQWTDIARVAAGGNHTVGLKSNGMVVAVGDNSDFQVGGVNNWTNVIQIAASRYHTVGLKSDGTVVATGRNDNGQCNVTSWTNIVQVAAGNFHTVGLKTDGTVVAAGSNSNTQCDIGSWSEIVQISAGSEHTVGLKDDGTVVAVGARTNNFGQCNVSSWTDIQQLVAGWFHTVGLKTDHTVVAVGWNINGQCNVGSWFLGTVNHPPTAANDSYIISSNSLEVSAPGVLTNDLDIDGNPLTAVKVSNPLHGSVTLNSNGSFSYIPAAGYRGNDSFTYKANDGTFDSNLATVSLTINESNSAPVVTVHPVSQTVITGTLVSFTAIASGYPSPSVQWQTRDNSTDIWNNINGATSSPYSFTVQVGNNDNQYRAVFSNVAGTANSNPAILTVTTSNSAPVVTKQPVSQTVSEGETATFSASASGNPVPTVQWQQCSDGETNWTEITGATETSYITSATTLSVNGRKFRAKFTNISGSAITQTASLTVKPANVATQVRVETASNGTGKVVVAQTVVVGSTMKVYGVTRNQSANFISNAAVSWSLINKTGGITDSDLVSAADGKSAAFTAHKAGTAKIRAMVSGLISIDSGVITVMAPAPPPPVVIGGGGFGGGSSGATLKPVGFASEKVLELSGDGVLNDATQLQTTDGKVIIDIGAKTKLLSAGISPLSMIILKPVIEPPAAPPSSAIIMAYELGPEGATFSPDLTLTFKFGGVPDKADPSSVRIAYWNGGSWLTLPGNLDTVKGTISTNISHFNTYAVITDLLTPAKFTISNLMLSSNRVPPGETISIQTTLVNEGGQLGTHRLTLKVNGVGVETKDISMAAGNSQDVVFHIYRNSPGEYSVEINGKSGNFSVVSPPTNAQSSNLIPPVANNSPIPAGTNPPVISQIPTTNAGAKENPAAPVNWWIWVVLSLGIILTVGLCIALSKRKPKMS